jgi:hypothetical protein
VFFFEKKNQKTFVCIGQRPSNRFWADVCGQWKKSLLLLFSKKEAFFYSRFRLPGN